MNNFNNYNENILYKSDILSKSDTLYSKEVLALFVFIGMYIFIRMVESFVIPRIPYCITKEVSSLFRLGPILVPIIFGITYIVKSKKGNIQTSNTILEDRMKSWMK